MKIYFALIQVNRGPHSHLLYYVFFMKKQTNKMHRMASLKDFASDKSGKKKSAKGCLLYIYAGQPSFITFDPQVPHLSFYEHLKIQLLKTFPNSQFFSFSGILVIWKSTRWAAAALQQF